MFDTASDAKWTDKAFASNDTGSYTDIPTVDNVKVGAKAKLTATVTLDADATGLDGAEASDGSYNAIQLACAMKTGDSWDYVKSGDYRSSRLRTLSMASAIYHLHLMYQRWEMCRRSYSSTIPTQHMLARSQ